MARARIEALVDLVLRAPSAGNTRSLHVLVLADDDVTRYWDTSLPAEARSDFPWPGLLRAPVLVVPYVEPSRYVERYAEPDKVHTGLGAGEPAWSVPYWWVDGGAAVQNLLLGVAATDDLGACFFGQFEHEAALRRAFGVPDGLRALGTIAIGVPDGNDRPSVSAHRPRPDRGEIVHWGHW